jgi:hypothetical protein
MTDADRIVALLQPQLTALKEEIAHLRKGHDLMMELRVDVARLQERQLDAEVGRLNAQLASAEGRIRVLEEERAKSTGSRWAVGVGWMGVIAVPGYAGLIIALLNLFGK